ncbi:DUF2520 domain-containing protein [Nocardioides zeae]|uniref:DUF2520 domain-containing protein n=1 Tax=Nocardioides imazamoxiresistens TaxID=3231893 RepID=A0ABU3PZL4_9ACTN|nr:DUF2520 domain-containing protein [Nocardioides zeae]MDT9594708.1 DUF2520 domain-containing protein [Nocardioides zeae]
MSSSGTPLSCSGSDAPLRVGAIGAGRVGAVLTRALADAGHHVVAVSGESDASRERAAALLPGVPLAKPSDVARAADLLLLTVPDDMLGNVVQVLAAAGALRPGQLLAHTSGAHGLAVLAPAAAVGARTLALHPALTFTGTATDLPRLRGCAYGVTVAAAERPLAERLVADVGGRPLWVAEEHRALYHAALAHGANHLVTLVAQAREILAAATDRGTGTPGDAAELEAVLRPLLGAALDNALRHGDAALTGPVARGDVATVARHVEELEAHAPQASASYAALARATVDRVTTDGRLLPIRARRLLEVLGGRRSAGRGARPDHEEQS